VRPRRLDRRSRHLHPAGESRTCGRRR
jgi:hypothetical protein